MSNHTPTPWRLAEGLERGDRTRQFIWPDAETREEREDGSLYCIATVNAREHVETMEANAAHIVRCVNAHGKLVEALDALIVGIGQESQWLATKTPHCWERLTAAMDAAAAVLDQVQS